MAFDAGMVYAISRELDSLLGENNDFHGSRIDKITMPERDEIHLLLHRGRDNYRLVVSASSNNPRIHLTNSAKENPNTPPSFCMLLRKYLTGSRLMAVKQLGFERVVQLEFDFKDEMGYVTKNILFLKFSESTVILCFAAQTRKYWVQ